MTAIYASRRLSCRRCEVEWLDDDGLACWACGLPGRVGPLPPPTARYRHPDARDTNWRATA